MPEPWPKESPAVYATALECVGKTFGELSRSSLSLVRFRVDAEPDPEKRLRKILASCAIPWCFDAVELGGRRYVDGGWDSNGGDNVPVRPILRRHPDIRTIVVVRCNAPAVEPGCVAVHSRNDIRIVEIRPRRILPGLFATQIAALGEDMVNDEILKWCGTVAFRPELADTIFRQGLEDDRETFSNPT